VQYKKDAQEEKREERSTITTTVEKIGAGNKKT
jgi:hypothetical protein